MTDRITGRLVTTYSVVVPADPGWTQPERHRDTDPSGGEPDRDEAPAGGGWQPAAWGEVPGALVLAGETYGEPSDHRGTGSHRGTGGRGAGRGRVPLATTDTIVSGDRPGALLGAAGANNGGISPTGVSAAWASPPVGRRRADGGTVTRAGGLSLGHLYTIVTERHRQGLHLNRPTLRFIRTAAPAKSTDRAERTAGPIQPRSRALVRPAGVPDEAPAAPAKSQPIGGGWAL